jgi:hypothetical protein
LATDVSFDSYLLIILIISIVKRLFTFIDIYLSLAQTVFPDALKPAQTSPIRWDGKGGGIGIVILRLAHSKYTPHFAYQKKWTHQEGSDS